MNQNRRFFVLDLVRGIAVLLMILSHSIYFFHNRDNSFILSLEAIGNIFCFVFFLFISGATLYVAYLRDEIDKAHIISRLKHRILLLLVTYYLLAFFIVGKEFAATGSLEKLKMILDILFFRQMPSFTEYIPPFLFSTFTLMLFPLGLAKISRSLTKTLLLSIGLYFAGYLLNHLSVPAYLIPWKAFFAGAEGLYRFPILHYAPVFLIGLYAGSKLIALDGRKAKLKFFSNAGIVAALVFIFVTAMFYFDGSIGNLLLRWPPTPTFLLLGIGAVMLMCYFLFRSRNLSKLPILRDIILVFGQNAYAIFWTHIFLLSFYSMAGGEKISSFLLVLLLFVAVLILSLALATFLPFNFKLSLTLNRDSHEEQEDVLESQAIVQLGEEVAVSGRKEWRFLRRFFFIGLEPKPGQKRLVKKRHILLISLLALGVVLFFSPSIVKEVETGIRENKKIEWWGNEYGYRQNIRVTNKEALTSLVKGEKIEIVFDHSQLVDKYQIDPLGRDLALAYYNGKETNKLEYILKNNWDREDTTIIVTLPETIGQHNDNINLFLYFGGSFGPKVLANSSENILTKSDYVVSFEKVEQRQVLASVDTHWKIIDTDGKVPALLFTAETGIELKEPVVTWKIIGHDLKGTMVETDTNIYSVKISTNQLLPGMYNIVANISDGADLYQSQKCSFIVSNPLYVSWTIDWEGYDANEAYIKAMASIADEYDLPMTHYWNPRIYATTTITATRQAQLTDWLKSRVAKNDEYGLHLHLFYDLVESAGVEVRNTPNWGDDGDGYGVPLTAYTSEEQTKIIEKSRQLFEANGLENPLYFRAGAWFADLSTLTTLADLGFISDSSGRTSYDFGRNNIAGTWDLQPTTQPYFPSSTNQNISGTSNLSIIEIPDNGADSYWFTATQMIDRFNQNYPRDILTEKTQFTFLSHPHWFKPEEQQRAKTLLTHIGQYRADKDSGPVVFTTASIIGNAWSE